MASTELHTLGMLRGCQLTPAPWRPAGPPARLHRAAAGTAASRTQAAARSAGSRQVRQQAGRRWGGLGMDRPGLVDSRSRPESMTLLGSNLGSLKHRQQRRGGVRQTPARIVPTTHSPCNFSASPRQPRGPHQRACLWAAGGRRGGPEVLDGRGQPRSEHPGGWQEDVALLQARAKLGQT